VSAAIAQETAVFDDEDEASEDEFEEGEEGIDEGLAPTDSITRRTPSTRGRKPSYSVSPAGQGELSPLAERGSMAAPTAPRVRLPGVDDTLGAAPSTAPRRSVSYGRTSGSFAARRLSTASGAMPAIFAHTGLQTPPAIAAAYEQEPIWEGAAEPGQEYGTGVSTAPGLSAIQERERRASTLSRISDRPTIKHPGGEDEKAAHTGWRALPLLLILQVGRKGGVINR
jgi:hypothetical protein